MKRSAFTLIELLVVISIIAILAGIALPVFNKVQERSRATNDASNLRQIGLGLQAYLNDRDDQMFPKEGKDDKSWPRLLNPKYVPGWKVFRSPFDVVTTGRPLLEQEPGVPVSYGINEYCFGINTSKFSSPSQLLVLAPKVEQKDPLTFVETSESHPKLTKPAPGQGGGDSRSRQKFGTHFNRSQINVLYGDWHVSSTPYLEFSNAENEEGKRRWYPEGEEPTN